MSEFVPVLVYLNNYLHDLATAFFFVTTLFAWWSRKNLPKIYPNVEARLRMAALISFALILILGQIRAWNYTAYEWLPALGRKQVPVLIGKHIILFLITAWAGLAWLKMSKDSKELQRGSAGFQPASDESTRSLASGQDARATL